MAGISNTEDYERKFLEKYLKLQAKRRIDELQQKIDEETDSFSILQLKREVKCVEEDLEKDLQDTQEKNVQEKLSLGEKTEQIEQDPTKRMVEIEGISIPLNVWNYLFEYQREGVKWMVNLYNERKGGVLADEMGLGKTIQCATFVIGLLNSIAHSKVLILCPATMVSHWDQQLTKLDPSLKVSSTGQSRVSILSYELFRARPLTTPFDCVFLDEGHKIKNKSALITHAVKKIRSKSRFVITKTPIQNNLGELWSIFDFINPNMLGSHTTFQEEFENRIRKSSSEREKQISYQYSVMLRSILEPFIMRRMKDQINHLLPEKADRVVFVKPTPKQCRMYIETLESKRFQTLKIMSFQSKGSLLSAIDYLRKICNHPFLVESSSFGSYKASKPNDSEGIRLNKLRSMCLDTTNAIQASGKMMVTFDFLEKWYLENKKTLIFFQTVQMLKIVEYTLLLGRQEYTFLSMTGSTSMKQRQSMIDTFNTDPNCFIFLLTTKVGGLGLNLTGASRAIIFDPDWNPSTDIQAKERIYRYGQTSNVEIYRLICKNTLEEKIYQKQIYKDCLSKKILSNPDTAFTRDYFFDLFSFHTNFDENTEARKDDERGIQTGNLVPVREEDKKDFKFFKRLNSKNILSGRELIDYIERREQNLDE